MDTAFQVAGDPDPLLAIVSPSDERGRILFGFAGDSRVPSQDDRLLTGSVEHVDNLMEGVVPDLFSAERTGEGLRWLVRKSGTNRNEPIDCLIEKC